MNPRAKWHEKWGRLISDCEEDTLAFESLDTDMAVFREIASINLKQKSSPTDFKYLKTAVLKARNRLDGYYKGET